MLDAQPPVLAGSSCLSRGCVLDPACGFHHLCSPCSGGNGANAAAAIAKLGGKARLVSKVGGDAAGRMLVEELEVGGVDCAWVLAGEVEVRHRWSEAGMQRLAPHSSTGAPPNTLGALCRPAVAGADGQLLHHGHGDEPDDRIDATPPPRRRPPS